MKSKNKKGASSLTGLYYGPLSSKQKIEEQICSQVIQRCESNRFVLVGNFNFPNIDWDLLSVKGLDGPQFLTCIQEDFLKQYVESYPRR